MTGEFMLIKSEYVCEKGSAEVNEDIANITESGAWVLDGATGLNGYNLIDDGSDASWYVNWWNNYLINNLKQDKSLVDLIKDGIHNVKYDFLSLASRNEINDLDMPSSSFFVVRWNKDKTKLEYCGLGDCMFIIKNKDGINNFYDKNLSKFDSNVLSKLGHVLNTMDVTHADGKLLIMEDIINNRLKKDKPDGYYILGFNKDSAYHMMQGEINIDGETEIIILSDGFYALFDKYEHMSLNDFIDNVSKGDTSKLYKQLREIEHKDNSARKFPRFKINDDASMVYLKLC